MCNEQLEQEVAESFGEVNASSGSAVVVPAVTEIRLEGGICGINKPGVAPDSLLRRQKLQPVVRFCYFFSTCRSKCCRTQSRISANEMQHLELLNACRTWYPALL